MNMHNYLLSCMLPLQRLASSKTRTISVCFQGKLFSIVVIQVYVLTCNAEEAEIEWFYEDLQDLLELTPKKDILFIIAHLRTA